MISIETLRRWMPDCRVSYGAYGFEVHKGNHYCIYEDSREIDKAQVSAIRQALNKRLRDRAKV